MTTSVSKCIRATLLGSALLLTVSAQAAQPSAESLDKLAKLMQFDHNLEMMMQFPPQVRTQLAEQVLPKDKKLTPEQRQQFVKAFDAFITEVMQSVNTPEIRTQVEKAFVQSSQQVLTQEEVDAMIHFYDNPIGQSIIKKQPAWMQDYMGKTMSIMMPKEQQAIRAALPKLKKSVEAIVGTEDKGEQKK